MEIDRIFSEADKIDQAIFEFAREAIWRISSPHFFTHAVEVHVNIYGLFEVKIYGIQFDSRHSILTGTELGNAGLLSYLRSRKSMILSPRENHRVRGK